MKYLSLVPRVSEKAYAAATAEQSYVFVVPKAANKLEIAQAVREQFGVEVTTVNTVVLKGKHKRTYRRGKVERGVRSDVKKAYVTLKAGQSIPLFATEDAAAAGDDKPQTKEKQ